MYVYVFKNTKIICKIQKKMFLILDATNSLTAVTLPISIMEKNPWYNNSSFVRKFKSKYITADFSL